MLNSALKPFLAAATAVFFPLAAYAQAKKFTVTELINKIITGIVNPLIALLFALATAVFLWGVIQYVIGSGGDEKRLSQGKQIMVWGIIGMFLMASAWGIISILCDFFESCQAVFGR